MAGLAKRAMAGNFSQASKRRKVRTRAPLTVPLCHLVLREFHLSMGDAFAEPLQGGDKWRKQQGEAAVESGDWGVLLTCDMGREGKCIAEALDVFSQVHVTKTVRL